MKTKAKKSKSKSTVKRTTSVRQKRVLAISHFSFIHNRAGGEKYLLEVLKHLSKEYEVDWVAFDNQGGDETIDGVNIMHGSHLKEEHDYDGYDYIVSHFAYSTFAYEKAQQVGAKFILLMHNDDTRGDYDTLIPKADLVIYNTEWIREAWESRGVVSANSIVVHPPVQPDEHKVEKTGDKVTLVNTTTAKGGILLYNLSKLMPKVQFLAVMGGYGAQNDKLLRERPNVEIMQNQTDMKNVWKETKVLLAPSQYESWGMCMVEACVNGIPVIWHNTPGLNESMKDSGIKMDNFSLIKWKTAINKLLIDSEYYSEQSDKALSHSKTNNSLEALKELTERLKAL